MTPTTITKVPSGTPVTYSEDKTTIIIGDKDKPLGTIKATPSESTDTKIYTFEKWSEEPDTIDEDTNFEANFLLTEQTVTITVSIVIGQID